MDMIYASNNFQFDHIWKHTLPPIEDLRLKNKNFSINFFTLSLLQDLGAYWIGFLFVCCF